jgi:nucleoid-associated protein YgaU
MRTDVKVGLFLGIVALLLAGWFYWPTSTNRTAPVGEAARPVVVPAAPTAARPTEPRGAAAPGPIAPSITAGSPPVQTPPGTGASPEVAGPAAIGREPLVHVVSSGESLEQIAELYYKGGDTPYDQAAMVALLRQANPQIARGTQLRAGSKIRIPAREGLPAAESAGHAPVDPAQTTAGASMATPAPATPSFVSAASSVKGPSTQPASASATGGRSYKVQRGDTLYSIALRQLGSPKRWHEVLQLNSTALNGKPEALRAGQVLRLPG